MGVSFTQTAPHTHESGLEGRGGVMSESVNDGVFVWMRDVLGWSMYMCVCIQKSNFIGVTWAGLAQSVVCLAHCPI